MRQVTIRAAKTNLSKLIEAALSGEEIVIAKGNRPVVRLVAVAQGKFKIGLLKGLVDDPSPDFFAPMGKAELSLWEGGE